MSARTRIVKAFVTEIKKMDGVSPYTIALHENVKGRQEFWDEVNSYPAVRVTAGNERREYQAADFKWGFLQVSVKIYTKGEECQQDLEDIMEDVENIMNTNHACLQYEVDGNLRTSDIRLIQLTTDEGVLFPIGVGEMLFSVRYEVL